MPTSSSQALLMPSPQRTGEPISWRFSIISTFAPCLAAHLAVIEPAGPAPITSTSVFKFCTAVPPFQVDAYPIAIAPTGHARTQISHRVQIFSSKVIRVSSR